MNIFEAGCALTVASAACMLGGWLLGPRLDVAGPALVAVVTVGVLALIAQELWVRFRARRGERRDRER